MQASGIKTTNSFAQICRCRWNVAENVHGSATMGFKHRWHHLSSLLYPKPHGDVGIVQIVSISFLQYNCRQLLIWNIDGTTFAHCWTLDHMSNVKSVHNVSFTCLQYYLQTTTGFKHRWHHLSTLLYPRPHEWCENCAYCLNYLYAILCADNYWF